MDDMRAEGWDMAMAAKKGEAKTPGGKGDDWFDALDAELEKKTQ